MEESKLDRIIREKFQDRNLEPSISSWERMENMLDESEKKSKKNVFYFIGIAASIILLLGIFLKMNTNTVDVNTTPVNNNIIVTAPEEKENVEDKILIEKKITVEEDIVENTSEIALVKEPVKAIKSSDKSDKVMEVNLDNPIKVIDKTFEVKKNQESFAAKNTDVPVELKNLDNLVKPVTKKNRIQINGEDLLYAVTHTPTEVKEYYANLKLNRNDVLDSIKFQLKKSNLKINPELILAEVERSIEDDEYEGNFKENIGIKISNIIVAIADRNK
ncbi:hypothetical protein [Tenacibaculum sp. 190524A05c]|uniref:hypothetical protein n=1 Tax=Tenacibaculum platacis TaxID=3137852 RepID=UPI0032B24E97